MVLKLITWQGVSILCFNQGDSQKLFVIIKKVKWLVRQELVNIYEHLSYLLPAPYKMGRLDILATSHHYKIGADLSLDS